MSGSRYPNRGIEVESDDSSSTTSEAPTLALDITHTGSRDPNRGIEVESDASSSTTSEAPTLALDITHKSVLAATYAEQGFTTWLDTGATVTIMKKKVDGQDYSHAVVIFDGDVCYHGIYFKNYLFVLNPTRDDIPDLPNVEYYADCKIAMRMSPEYGDCYVTPSPEVFLVCKLPAAATDPVKLHGFYQRTGRSYTEVKSNPDLLERLQEIEDILSADKPYNITKIRRVIDSLVVAPQRWYGSLERIVAGLLASADPLCTFDVEAEPMYTLAGALFSRRAPSTKPFFPAWIQTSTQDDFGTVMNTLRRWQAAAPHFRILRATHVVIHATYAFRIQHGISPAVPNLITLALLNRPLPTAPMTLTEAVIILHLWQINSRHPTEVPEDLKRHLIEVNDNQFAFDPVVSSDVVADYALFDSMERYTARVLAALTSNTLQDPDSFFTIDGQRVRPISSDKGSVAFNNRPSDNVTLFVEVPPALSRALELQCNHTSAIVRPLASFGNLKFTILEPGNSPYELTKTVSSYARLMNANVPAWWSTSFDPAAFCSMESYGSEVVLLLLGRRDAALCDVHIKHFFYVTADDVKTNFFEHCRMARRDVAPRMLMAIRDVAFDHGAQSLSVQDAFSGYVKYNAASFEQIDSSKLQSAAGAIANEIVGGTKTTPKRQAIFKRHGDVPSPVKGPQTPGSFASAVAKHGYYGRVGFIQYNNINNSDLTANIGGASTHICPRPAQVDVEYKNTVTRVSIPWSFSDRNAFNLICREIGVGEHEQENVVMHGGPFNKELQPTIPKTAFFYQWHQITMDPIRIAVKERPSLKRPAEDPIAAAFADMCV